MKKTLLSLAIAGAAFGSANAQLPVGAVAPDFTLTDINGVSHHLYDYLDQGYTVLIDISAAWCGPCWAAHESGFMKNLHDQYGPTGTVAAGKIKVIYVEGEATNTGAQLTGTSTGNTNATYSQGDWVTGEPYVFIDNATLNTPYAIGGFPTFTVICPNRRVAHAVSGYGSAMAQTSYWTPFMTSCPVAVTGTNVGTINVTTPSNVCAGGPTMLKAEIQNLGTATLTAAVITAKVNGAVVATKNWSGSLPKYGSEIVEIGNYTFAAASTSVTYEATTANDVSATDNAKVKASEALTSTFKTWKLQVKTDQYPGETTWRLKNSGGTVVQEHTYVAGPGQQGAGGADAGKIFDYTFNLNDNECYTIEVEDSYGDGLTGVQSAAELGYVKLSDANGGLIVDFGASFGDGASKIAKTGTQAVGIEKIIATSDMSLYPNPANDKLNVKVNMLKSSKVAFTIVNLVGQTILTEEKALAVGESVTTLNTTNLADGVYFLNIVTSEGSVQRKFVKK